MHLWSWKSFVCFANGVANFQVSLKWRIARLRNETFFFFYLISLLVRLNFAHMVLATDGKDVSIKEEVNYRNISFYTEFQIFWTVSMTTWTVDWMWLYLVVRTIHIVICLRLWHSTLIILLLWSVFQLQRVAEKC